MKARIPAGNRFSKKQKAEIHELSRELVEQENKKAMRRYFKLMCYVLNRDFGFGNKRCLSVIDGISKLLSEHEHDEIFWQHLDRVIIDEMKLDFEREREM